jgi:hypothetical protein
MKFLSSELADRPHTYTVAACRLSPDKVQTSALHQVIAFRRQVQPHGRYQVHRSVHNRLHSRFKNELLHLIRSDERLTPKANAHTICVQGVKPQLQARWKRISTGFKTLHRRPTHKAMTPHVCLTWFQYPRDKEHSRYWSPHLATRLDYYHSESASHATTREDIRAAWAH